jgi:hypothetical protein
MCNRFLGAGDIAYIVEAKKAPEGLSQTSPEDCRFLPSNYYNRPSSKGLPSGGRNSAVQQLCESEIT